MKQILTVFTYTFKEGIRKKTFLISTAIIMVILLLLCFAPRIIALFEGEPQGENQESTADVSEKEGLAYLIDETGIFEAHIESFQAVYPNFNFQIREAEELEALKSEVKEDDKKSIIYIQQDQKSAQPSIRIINTNFMKGMGVERISEVCSSIWQAALLAEAGVQEDVIIQAQLPLVCVEEAVGEMDLTGYILGLVMTFVMFFAVYYYGYGVAMSVASEKTSRVMETLIISAKPSRILIGKCLAMGALGILQLGVLLLFGLACYQILMPNGFEAAGLNINLSGFSAGTILLLLLYFILGYALYAVINSVCGAAVSKVEDLNSAMMPVSVISILGFYLGYFTSVAGGGSNALSQLAVYLPISSPFAVPFKILTKEIETGELLISMVLLIAAIVAVAALSSKLYSASVMHYGNKLKWKDLKKRAEANKGKEA